MNWGKQRRNETKRGRGKGQGKEKEREGARRTIVDERETSDTLSLPQELFLLANGFSIRNCVVQYRKRDRRHVSGGQGEAAGTVACISFVSAFSEVKGEEPQGNNT
jgi:hypothetical protein